MAFSAAMEWEVRTTGSNSNGGGFKAGASGTDYSQQDSAQVAYTDLVIDGTTNTKCTSAAHPFTSAHVGNVINITGGTGFTVQRVQINSVASGEATCDKSLGTLASTGGTGNLGGGLLTVAQAIAVMVASNVVHIKSGTYTITSALAPSALSGGSAGYTSFIGYSSTHRDGGTKPLITSSTNSIKIFALAGGNCWRFSNLSISHTAGTRGNGIHALNATVTSVIVDGCLFDGCNVAIEGNYTVDWEFVDLLVFNTEIKNSVSHAIRNASYTHLQACYIHDNGGDGFNSTTTSRPFEIIVERSIFYNNVAGVKIGANASTQPVRMSVSNCSFSDNTNSAIVAANGGSNSAFSLTAINNIFYNNSVYGVNMSIANDDGQISKNNAFGANGTAARNNYPVGSGDVTLSADPFTNRAGGDFSLNSTAGGGAACKAAGFQYVGSNMDIGALQSGSAGGGLLTNPGAGGGLHW